MLITPEYAALNSRLMEEDPTYATSGHKMAPRVLELCKRYETKDVLDYGCGRMLLQKALGFKIYNYDPAVWELSSPPSPSEIVVCGDVLEHVEPECLDDVMADLYRVTQKVLLVLVATRPALRSLPDGRNAHLIQEKAPWWLGKFWDSGFRLLSYLDCQAQGHSLSFIGLFDKGE